MSKTLLRTMAAFAVGVLVSFALIFGVEVLSNLVHPFPIGFEGTKEEICHHVARYPSWVLGVVVVAWGLTAAIGTWIAQRMGGFHAATALGLLLIAGVAMNISMLPYPIWFKVVIMIAVPIAVLVGIRLALQRATTHSSD